ncbi:MAG: hypothetical protein U0R52_09710 [Solirubrobacterales bacterium]
MRLRRVRAAEAIAGAGGLAMLVALFLPWFEPGVSGWTSLSVTDLLVAGAAAMAIALPAVSAGQAKDDLPIVGTALTCLAGVIALAAVLARLADPLGVGREAGIYLALGGALAVVGGCWWAMKDERRRA